MSGAVGTPRDIIIGLEAVTGTGGAYPWATVRRPSPRRGPARRASRGPSTNRLGRRP
jgi:hypothetical protein